MMMEVGRVKVRVRGKGKGRKRVCFRLFGQD